MGHQGMPKIVRVWITVMTIIVTMWGMVLVAKRANAADLAQVYDPPPWGWGPDDGGPPRPDPRGYWREPPPPPPGAYGPQMEPCIYYGDCMEQPRRGPAMPPFRYPGSRDDD